MPKVTRLSSSERGPRSGWTAELLGARDTLVKTLAKLVKTDPARSALPPHPSLGKLDSANVHSWRGRPCPFQRITIFCFPTWLSVESAASLGLTRSRSHPRRVEAQLLPPSGSQRRRGPPSQASGGCRVRSASLLFPSLLGLARPWVAVGCPRARVALQTASSPLKTFVPHRFSTFLFLTSCPLIFDLIHVMDFRGTFENYNRWGEEE